MSVGARVTVVDEAARPGGQIYRQAHPALKGGDFAEASERARKERLIGAFERVLDRIEYRAGTSAFALFKTGELHVASGSRTEVLRADAIILTTGVREIAVPFAGWTTPGVMYAGGAQALLKSQSVLAGRRIVVAGVGPLPIVVAAQILRAGGKCRGAGNAQFAECCGLAAAPHCGAAASWCAKACAISRP